MLGGIIQFVIAASTLKIDLMDQMQAVQQGNHAKDGGVVGAASLGGGEFLDFLERQRSSGSEERLDDTAASGGIRRPSPRSRFKMASAEND